MEIRLNVFALSETPKMSFNTAFMKISINEDDKNVYAKEKPSLPH